jgi:nickel/cobalt transporter (NiCoT) family protein
MFVATWVIALAVWRFGHVEEKWMAGMEAAATPEDLALLEGMKLPK